jgi:DNA-binding transcriptional LysR family regulator
MAPLVRDALKALEAAVELPKFEPGGSTKNFTIAANDFTTMVIARNLLGILAAEAPLIDLAIKPVTRIDLAAQIDLGRIDVAIGPFSAVPPRFKSDFLFGYDDVLITHSGQKLGAISTETLAKLSIVVVSFGGEQEGAIDGFISERGLPRRSEMCGRTAFDDAFSASSQVPRVAVSLQHFLALPALLDDSSLAAIVPRPLANSFAATHPVVIYELPYATARLEVRSLWHERRDGHASQNWLHVVLRRATEHLRIDAVLPCRQGVRLTPRYDPAPQIPSFIPSSSSCLLGYRFCITVSFSPRLWCRPRPCSSRPSVFGRMNSAAIHDNRR